LAKVFGENPVPIMLPLELKSVIVAEDQAYADIIGIAPISVGMMVAKPPLPQGHELRTKPAPVAINQFRVLLS
jgi:hypothetical protein